MAPSRRGRPRSEDVERSSSSPTTVEAEGEVIQALLAVVRSRLFVLASSDG
jgi:hypothetical protein